MKTHPELFAWLFLAAGFAILTALAALVYHWRSILQWVAEWCFVISEIYHGRGKRWQDEG